MQTSRFRPRRTRRQPLMAAITTAGFDKTGYCYQQREYACRILDGDIADDSFFAIIYTLDDPDKEWTDEAAWAKANPNLGVSVSPKYLRDEFLKAREMPSAKVNFLTKLLNVWTDAAECWVDMDAFDTCRQPFELSELTDIPIWFGGLDLAQSIDLCAFVLLGKLGETLYCKPFFYLPEETAEKRWRKNQIPYPEWAKKGYIRLTPGNICDYNFIKADIRRILGDVKIADIGYDRYNASQLVLDLINEDGVPMTEVIQGAVTLNPAMREWERLYIGGNFIWDGNPVLRWMAGNLQVKTDENGNLRPDRRNSREKIDGMAALFDALCRLMTHERTPDPMIEVWEW